MQAKDLKCWSLLVNLDTSTIRKVFLFENKAVVLKHDGTICEIDQNSHQVQATTRVVDHYNYGNSNTTYGGTTVNSGGTIINSGGTRFKDVITNGEHGLAISPKGILYSWGSNAQGQLGRAGCCTNLLIVEKVFAVRIKEAACASGLSFALTTENRVFEWGKYGFNEFLLESEDELDKPREEGEKEKIVSIHGTKHYVMILTESGKVYIPPFKRSTNKCDILHTERIYAFEGPMKRKKIIQVLSSLNYVFALTSDGEIFMWELLPVYTCDCNSLPEPKRIAGNIRRVVKIWAALSGDVLVAVDNLGNLHSITWNGSGILLSTSPIKFSSAGMYFATLGIKMQGPVYDERAIDMNVEEDSSIWRGKFESAFNNEESSDISFIFDDKIIYAHRSILSTQSSYLNSLLKDVWNGDTETNQFKIENYSYPTFLNFTRFLYTGKLENSSHESSLDLLKLAHEYEENLLLDLCKKLVIKGLTAENSFSAYKVADLLGLEDMMQACKTFIGKNFKDVILSEDISKKDVDKTYLLRFVKDMFN